VIFAVLKFLFAITSVLNLLVFKDVKGVALMIQVEKIRGYSPKVRTDHGGRRKRKEVRKKEEEDWNKIIWPNDDSQDVKDAALTSEEDSWL